MIPHSKLAAYCAAVYGLDDTWLLTTREVDCLVVDEGNCLILAFRGTQASVAWPLRWSWEGLSNTRDIIRDLRFIPWKDPRFGVWMHKGFGISADWWAGRFMRELPTDKKIIVTGHSLGAGIAPHVARILKHHDFDVEEVVLFGEPKGHYWKSRHHYQQMNIRTTSYRNKRDWIKYAGIGRLTVEPIILNPDTNSRFESHDIERYHSALMNNRGL